MMSSLASGADAGAGSAGAWLAILQDRLNEQIGEPVLLTIRLIYDGTLDIDVETFSGRHGGARGETLTATLEAAVECLFYLDPFIAPEAR